MGQTGPPSPATQTQFLRKGYIYIYIIEAGTQSSSSLGDAKKRQRIDDFLYPFQVPSDFLFPIFFFLFFLKNPPPLVCINLPFRKKSRLHAVFDIPLTRASRGLFLSGEKKKRKERKTTKSAPNVKWGRNARRKRNEKKKEIVINPEIARWLL